jgi:hypothetical protein
MFRLGDFVRFVDEKREGYITRVIDTQMVGVTDTDGFEIPVAISNLTHVHGHGSTNQAEIRPEVVTTAVEFKSEGIFLAVVPDSKASAVVHFYVINESSFQLLFALSTALKGKYKGEFASIVQPQTFTQVYSANLGDLEIWPEFIGQGLYFTSGDIQPKAPLTFQKKFKAKDFNDSKNLIPMLNKYGWANQLDKPAPIIDPQKLKESFFRGSNEKSIIAKPPLEVDLHIEKLRDDHQFLDQSEILTLQLSHFERALDAAITHKMDSIVFIHGVGNGTLRHHIHKVISKHPQVRTFMDARKEKFGFGATEVVFKV